MSDFIVVHEVSKALRDIVWRGVQDDVTVRTMVGPIENIVFANPTDTAQAASNTLSIWLYQITENEFLKNRAPDRRPGTNANRVAPLALDLYYLVTPFVGSGDSEQNNHLLLGKVMQSLHDNATLPLQREQPHVAEELRIVLCRLTLEELTRIWEALQQPYRLSICYRVHVMQIDSQRETMVEPVRAKVLDYGPSLEDGGR